MIKKAKRTYVTTSLNGQAAYQDGKFWGQWVTCAFEDNSKKANMVSDSLKCDHYHNLTSNL